MDVNAGGAHYTAPPLWLAYVSPLAGPAVALLVSLIWRRGLARYQGVGN